eukprot:754656-Hanusia_phi.AAC.4
MLDVDAHDGCGRLRLVSLARRSGRREHDEEKCAHKKSFEEMPAIIHAKERSESHLGELLRCRCAKT